MYKPRRLNSLKFENKEGIVLVSEDTSVQFTYLEDLEKHLQSRLKYWEETLGTILLMTPDHNETLTDIEIRNIIRMFCKKLGLPIKSVISKSRKTELVEARRMIINYCLFRKMLKTVIASNLGMTHCNVLHHELTHSNLMDTDKIYNATYKTIFNHIDSKLQTP